MTLLQIDADPIARRPRPDFARMDVLIARFRAYLVRPGQSPQTVLDAKMRKETARRAVDGLLR